jgi:hypothetical protein
MPTLPAITEHYMHLEVTPPHALAQGFVASCPRSNCIEHLIHLEEQCADYWFWALPSSEFSLAAEWTRPTWRCSPIRHHKNSGRLCARPSTSLDSTVTTHTLRRSASNGVIAIVGQHAREHGLIFSGYFKLKSASESHRPTRSADNSIGNARVTAQQTAQSLRTRCITP